MSPCSAALPLCRAAALEEAAAASAVVGLPAQRPRSSRLSGRSTAGRALVLAAAFGAALLLATEAASAAWVPAPTEQGPVLRRRWLSAALAAASIASLGAPENVEAVNAQDKFDGSFQDPAVESKCPEGCERTINAQGGFALIEGRDRKNGKMWNLFATYDGKDISVDMTPRGGPKKMMGKWNGKEKSITWADGSVWEKMMFKITPAPFEINMQDGERRQQMLEAGLISKRR